MIVRVLLDGLELSLDDVLAAVTVRHGRHGPDDAPTPSSATITLVGADRALTSSFEVGVELELVAEGAAGEAPRFTGTVSDAILADDDTLEVLAVGTLAQIGRFPVGAADWPAETWSTRLRRVIIDAGLELDRFELVAPAHDPRVAPRSSSPTTFAAELAELARTIAAAVADLPDGRVLVQPLSSRPIAPGLDADPALVLYAPEWTMVDDVANTVAVSFGAGGLSSTAVSDTASVARFGPRPRSITTQLESFDDAQARALEELGRLAFPDWTVDSARIAGYDDRLEVGAVVTVPSLPASAPVAVYAGIVEGWEDRFDGVDWLTSVFLTAPRLSGVGLTWDDAVDEWDEAGTATWRIPDAIGV